ncbi:hypothetical protein MNBD_GAMMA02-1265 [hydrothermal vent metagenome]|uniref:Uncharacterized protein n=1 Tax=hydrothermal vent metagenome TaxID=652676 RepID=A0A3B0VWH8_9ZZZZ
MKKTNMNKITITNMACRTTVFLLLSIIGLAFTVQADVLLIDRVEAIAGTDVPQKSATMNQVRSQYGDPMNEYAAVGEPPITRWDYADFTVYFEHQHVITAVLKKSKPTEIGPESVESTDG